MTAPTLADFDEWRNQYAVMSDDDRRAWDSRCYQFWPEQAHGSLDRIRAYTAGATHVVEVGGWRGDHAAAVLAERPDIRSWTNIEFCGDAARNGKPLDLRYRVTLPAVFRWWKEMRAPSGDVLILSHVIEHLDTEDLEGLLTAVNHIPRVYVEAPLPYGGTTWQGYLGTHILPWGWSQVERAFEDAGYELSGQGEDMRTFRKIDP